MRCYFDGSQGIADDSDQWMTLAGLVASDAVWADFQTQWEAMLSDRYPIAPFIHMTDLVVGKDPFERLAGWTHEKKLKLALDAANVLQGLGIQNICAFYCTINETARLRLLTEGCEIDEPEIICAETGVGNSISWYDRTHALEMVYLFFDQGEPYMHTIRRRWLQYDDPGKLVTDQLFWGRIANIQPMIAKNTPAIQAADLIAWAVSRRHRDEPEDDWARLANLLVGRWEQPGILTATRLELDEATLRIKNCPGS